MTTPNYHLNKSLEKQFELKDILVISGGLGSLLEDLGYAANTNSLWSAGATIDAPDLLIHAHKLYIEAGATAIQTNTYNCSIQKMLDTMNYRYEEAEAVVKNAVQIARRAINEVVSDNYAKIKLIGSTGPYAIYLRDGSEYSGDYTKKFSFAKQLIIDYYRQQTKPLIETDIDFLLFETIPTLIEVECLREVVTELRVQRPNIKIWISVTCQDKRLTRGGDDFADVVKTICSFPTFVNAIGVNCTQPGDVTSLLEIAVRILENQKITPSPYFVVYPNSGEKFNTETKNYEGNTEIKEIVDNVSRWYALGARVIGGCCRIMPQHIRIIADACRAIVMDK